MGHLLPLIGVMLTAGVLSAQNVGIGTALPTHKLDVAGSVRIRDASLYNTLLRADPDGVISAVTLGAGLDFSGGTLNATGMAPTGTAGGDLSGIYPDPVVAQIQGRAVSAVAPGNGQFLVWNGMAWAPADPAAAFVVENALTKTTPNILRWGGPLTQNTGISQGGFSTIFDLTGTGDFEVRSAGNTFVFASDAGRLGVGTAAPSEQIHATGNIRADGAVMWGHNQTRTETRDAAGISGPGFRSGFYETGNPSPASQWPTGATNWWHLLDVRHQNPSNNHAMQIAGSFYDQNLWFRKTNNNPNQPWSRVLSTADHGNYIWNQAINNSHTIGQAASFDITGNAEIGGFLNFASQDGQRINLWGTGPNAPYGIGIQTNTMYFRTAVHYAWYLGGTHGGGEWNPGAGGTLVMALNSSGNLGIATSAPVRRLDVNGAARVRQTVFARNLSVDYYSEHRSPGIGADNQYHTISCPAGYAMVNFSAYASVHWDGFATTNCANLQGSLSGARTWRGGYNCDNCWHDSGCNSNEVMVGWQVYATSHFDAFMSVLCESVSGGNTRGTPFLSSMTTSLAGNAPDYANHESSCPPGTFATRMAVWVTTHLDGALHLWCAGIIPN